MNNPNDIIWSKNSIILSKCSLSVFWFATLAFPVSPADPTALTGPNILRIYLPLGLFIASYLVDIDIACLK